MRLREGEIVSTLAPVVGSDDEPDEDTELTGLASDRGEESVSDLGSDASRPEPADEDGLGFDADTELADDDEDPDDDPDDDTEVSDEDE